MGITLGTPKNVVSNVYNGGTWGEVVIDKEIFVGEYSNTSTKIYVYDVSTFALKRTLTVPTYNYTIGTDGIYLYVKNSNKQLIKVDINTGNLISTNTNITFSNMTYSANFKIDLVNDRIYFCDYSTTLYILKYSDGTLIKKYTLPLGFASGVEIIENKYILVSCYSNNKVYISPIIDNDVTNLSFNNLSVTFSGNIVGVGYYKGYLYFTSYNTNIIQSQISGLILNKTKFLLHDGNDVITVSDISAQYTDNSIPVMTSNTTPNGIVTCSKSNGSSYDAWYVFNRKSWRNGDSYWDISNISFPQWIAYEFDMKKIIGKYSLKAVWTVASRMPKDWTFEGSNDGTNWTVLDTQSGITWNDEEKKEFIINNINAYKKYRINITAIVSGNELSIDEIEMFEILSMTKNKRKIIGSYPPTEKDFLDNGMDKISSLYEQGDLTLDFVDKGQLGEGNLYECEFNAEELWEVNDFEVELE